MTTCSREKSEQTGLLPARHRYQHPRIDRVAAAATSLGLPLRILSGHFGLVEGDQPLPHYDHLLAEKEVEALAVQVARQLRELSVGQVAFFHPDPEGDPRARPYVECMQRACTLASVALASFPVEAEDAGPDEDGPSRKELSRTLALVLGQSRAYLDAVDHAPVRSHGLQQSLAHFGGALPESGDGAARALYELLEHGLPATVASSGPRCFHLVIGGTTPAALGADWLASALDQMAYAWVSSPLAAHLEVVALSWLKELFELPRAWSGILTTGATMANFVGLASARQWWGESQGVDVAQEGLGNLGPAAVFSSGYLHASAVKALSMLGMGRSCVQRMARDERGRLDEPALRRALDQRRGPPALLVANAGEVNAGDFDPIDVLADIAQEYGAWLHVDGAFGLFARLAPQTRELTRGVERAHSVTMDGHKWLNVPYDCGFAFVRDRELQARTFAFSADYLPDPADPLPNFGSLGPESSRRARSLVVWAALRAYGRRGYRKIVQRHLALAQRLADLVDEAADLERLAPVPLNIVCFRYQPGGLAESDLDRLNADLGEALLRDGRVYVGTTRFEGKVALRPAIVNWRTGRGDVELLVQVVRELGARLHEQPR